MVFCNFCQFLLEHIVKPFNLKAQLLNFLLVALRNDLDIAQLSQLGIEIIVDRCHFSHSHLISSDPLIVLVDFMIPSDQLVVQLTQFCRKLLAFVGLIPQYIVQPLDLFGKHSEFAFILMHGIFKPYKVRLLANFLIELSLDSPISELQLLNLPVLRIINVLKPLDLEIKSIDLRLELEDKLLLFSFVIGIRLRCESVTEFVQLSLLRRFES